eukprot:GHVS01071911.1.p1 GENE.GHVS01071911.1~~GHVS01071911.1.p1  ORF type:complete len:128 (+),score=15.43 GHVS01071911.1:180-563(+)
MAGRRPKTTGGSDLKIAIIGDEDTVTGFLMTGIGVHDALGYKNFFIATKDSSRSDLEEAFRCYTTRKDVGVVLINQHVADEIRYLVDAHDLIIPTILEIPSKDKPYDPARDCVMQRVKMFFGGDLPT